MTRSTCIVLAVAILAASFSAMRVGASRKIMEAAKVQPALPDKEDGGSKLSMDGNDNLSMDGSSVEAKPEVLAPVWDAAKDCWRNKTTGKRSHPPEGHSRAGVCAFPPFLKFDCDSEGELKGLPKQKKQEHCLAKGCCYKELEKGSSEPWCFRRESTCSMSDEDKEECGYYGIGSAECAQRGCCWQTLGKMGGPRTKEPWCFKPKGAVLQASEQPRPERKPEDLEDTGANTENAASAPKFSKPEVEWVWGKDGKSCNQACATWGGVCVEDSWPSSLAHFEEVLAETHESCPLLEESITVAIADSNVDQFAEINAALRERGLNQSHVDDDRVQIFTKDGALCDAEYTREHPDGPAASDFPLRVQLQVIKERYTACSSSKECEKGVLGLGGLAPYKSVQNQRCFYSEKFDYPVCSTKFSLAARFCPCKETDYSPFTFDMLKNHLALD